MVQFILQKDSKKHNKVFVATCASTGIAGYVKSMKGARHFDSEQMAYEFKKEHGLRGCYPVESLYDKI